jgi:mevalonate kinase
MATLLESIIRSQLLVAELFSAKNGENESFQTVHLLPLNLPRKSSSSIHAHLHNLIDRIPALRFLLTDTNQPRRTAILVAHVAQLLTTLPGVTAHILTAIDGIAAEACRLLESGENITERLGELISINQGLLNSVGVGHEKLDTVARITKDIGWTKLTGAGGGGCALTLLHKGTIGSYYVNGRRHFGKRKGC